MLSGLCSFFPWRKEFRITLRRFARMKTLLYFLIFAVLAGAGGYYVYHTYGTSPETVYTTAKVERGNLDLIIRATGTLEPEEVVDVGAQVAGLINDFGKDPD